MDSDEEQDTRIDELLQLHPALQLQEDSGRVRCTITGHEMVAREDTILQHINGKKYKRLSQGIKKPFDYTQYEPFLVETSNKGRENQLYCNLTLSYINKGPTYIEKHLNGKKFKRAKELWDECKKSGKTFESPFVKHEPKDTKKEKEDNDAELERLTNENEQASVDDDFSDLYPDEYFSNLSIESDDSIQKEIEASLEQHKPKRKASGFMKRKSKITKKQTLPKKRLRSQK